MGKTGKQIGIEVQRLFRPKKHGMEVVALELIRELQTVDSKHDYTVFVKKDVDRCIEESGHVRVRELASLPYPIWEQMLLPRSIRNEQLDILHATCNTAALFPSIPLVLTLHDIIYLEKLDMAGTWYQNFGNIYRRWVVPSAVRKAKAIITVSEFEKKVMLNRLQIPEDKIKVIHNAVNSRFNNYYLADEVEKFRKSLGLPDKFILFLGNTAPKKNTKNTIDAYIKYIVNATAPLPMVILDYSREMVFEQLQQSGYAKLVDYFVFPGYVLPDQMPLMYNSATLFIYPSLRESFGLPILEAMACGVPVITSNTSSMPEVAGGAALLIDPLDVTDMANAIERVLSNNEQRTGMIIKGLKRAEAFTWRNAAIKLLNVYESL